MLNSLAQFIAEHNGKFVDFDGAYGYQCEDLANFFARDVVGAPPFAGAGAIDAWSSFNRSYWTATANTPTNHPSPGDVVIWHADATAGTGIYGHIAICVSATPQSFVAFSQNWPTGSPCHEVAFGYAGVTGWLKTRTIAGIPTTPAKPQPPDPHTPAEYAAASRVAQVDRLASNVPVSAAPAAWAAIAEYVKAHA